MLVGKLICFVPLLHSKTWPIPSWSGSVHKPISRAAPLVVVRPRTVATDQKSDAELARVPRQTSHRLPWNLFVSRSPLLFFVSVRGTTLLTSIAIGNVTWIVLRMGEQAQWL